VTLPREAWPRLKEAFEGARALALDARPAYLAEVCNGDEALRHEVELLLAHNDQAASFLETPAMQVEDSLVAKSLEGQCIGPYQVSALIGTGGMGVVYSARDTKLNRHVAIKVLLPAVASERVRQDFERDVAIQFRIAGAVDLTHRAGTNRFDDLVRTHAQTSGEERSRLRGVGQWPGQAIETFRFPHDRQSSEEAVVRGFGRQERLDLETQALVVTRRGGQKGAAVLGWLFHSGLKEGLHARPSLAGHE